MKKSLILAGIFICAVPFLSFAQRPEAKKWMNYTEIGVLAGNPANENNTPFIFQSSLNYAFPKNLSAGLGAGVEFLKETYLPVTANLLYQFGNNQAITPFIRLQGGYQWALEDRTIRDNYSISSYYPDYISSYYRSEKLDARGGWLINPSLGVTLYTHSGLGISLAAGYRHQVLSYTGEEDYQLRVEYNRLSLTLGIIF